jgi:hypothetical protein
MPYAGEEPYRGPGQVVEKVLGPINADVENLRLEIREVIGLGAQVAALGTYYRADLPDAELHLLDTGHFALATHVDEIAGLIADFHARHAEAAARAAA